MTWSKLDDTLTQPDEPLSAFLGYGLTRNTNAYPAALSRLSTFAYPTTSAGLAKVKWAAYGQPRGTFVIVDVGINATNFVVKLFYSTTDAALGGQLYVRHADSGAQVQVAVAGSALPTSIEIPYTASRPLTGLQGFYIGWISDVSEEIGAVILAGAVGNQVFCEPDGAAFPFTLAAGSYTEMYHVLLITQSGTLPAPAGDALRLYQVCMFKHNLNAARPPHGVLVVWPEVEINPPIFGTSTTAPGSGPSAGWEGNLFELGRLELFSITVEVLDADDSTVLPPYAYQQVTPVNELNNFINSTMVQMQPNASTLQTTGGFLNCVLLAGEEATFAFFVQTFESVQQLLTSFQCLTFNAAQSSAVDITFGVRDYQGNTVGNDIVKPNYSVPRLAGQTQRVQSDDTMIAMNGVLAGDGNWGMRDAMSYLDGRKGVPVNFTWGPNAPGDIAQGSHGTTDAVYYGTITATSDLYIYGFNCRVF